MKGLLVALGVLGLAAVFSLSEPARASSSPVASDEVRLTSEHMSITDDWTSSGKRGRWGTGFSRDSRWR